MIDYEILSILPTRFRGYVTVTKTFIRFFTTLKAPGWIKGWFYDDGGWDGYHPISGNRQFGWSNVGGQIRMFTKGVDRVTNWYHYAFGYGKKKAFQGADQLWQSMEEELADFINNHGGEAEVFTTRKPPTNPVLITWKVFLWYPCLGGMAAN